MTRRRIEFTWRRDNPPHWDAPWVKLPWWTIQNKGLDGYSRGLRIDWLRAVVVFWYHRRPAVSAVRQHEQP